MTMLPLSSEDHAVISQAMFAAKEALDPATYLSFLVILANTWGIKVLGPLDKP